MKTSMTTMARIGTAAVIAASVGIAPAALGASAAPAQGARTVSAAQPVPTTIPVTGTLANGTAFTGSLSNLSTHVVNGVLQLTGTITGTGLPAGGTTFTAPIQSVQTSGSCTVLTLNLGPLHLDLLGLVVDLAPVNLNITAVPGPGNLLGNLVCAVAHLLDSSGSPLSGLSALLNRLLTGLGL